MGNVNGNGNENGYVVSVDKRLGVDECSQMQVVLGIVKYSLMGSDDGLRRLPFKGKQTDRNPRKYSRDILD